MSEVCQEQPQRVRAILEQGPLIPVITIRQAADALPLAEALLEGGIRVLEVTLRTPEGLKAIETLASRLPEAIVGAGTVTDPDSYQQAEQAGARFVVSPGVTPSLLHRGLTAEAPLLPGVASVSEMMLGYELGYRSFKFFPAAVAGGIPALKAFAGPFADVVFCPTGGIRRDTAGDYLALPNVLTVGGTWLTPDDLVSQGDWSGITDLARASLASCAGR